ncbi:SCO family protein [Stappia sp. F7233]|uniref:SCO family protein n=1 Tax=Stappia albiluteola TaxID=2758565 RepID=A0A839ADD1_9HYPH|nr:SCO family protein [Stappia albiluteola]MBA5777683.1 SCO family protein [Stappia albiluteola]
MIRWLAAAALGVAAAFAYDQFAREDIAVLVRTAALPGAASPDAGQTPAAAQDASAPAASPQLPDLGPALPFPIALEARFKLTDQDGRAVTEADFKGKPIALFFGYANCESVCSAVLPDIARALDILDEGGHKIDAVMITVDPDRDSPQAMKKALPRWHERLIGLTGSKEELQKVWDDFQVEHEIVGHDEKGGAIYAHGSLVYLIGPDSKLMTILPPVYGSEHMARIFERYVSG